ncbi:MAG TPA: acyl-CoA dehydrogenase family protein [Sphingopyxis sp.]|nr:acyl-CoA dehydrogenase family protein [Sphingopyxis sp.]HMP44924.1 acyl-CoA dehydrogenase family protein [Sphingopyxis sp.]HMQ18372.1 acyl-CoA dehydrogenase family protein [Sphingopyxis sp.]
MDFDFSADQRALAEAIQRIVADHRDLPRTGNVVEPRAFHPATEMEAALAGGGFFDIALEDECGAVEAAILVYEAGLSPLVLETGASVLIAPLLTGEALSRPVAVARLSDLTRGVRFLSEARTLIVDLGDDVAVVDMGAHEVVPLDGVYAYPIGKFAAEPDLSAARRLGAGKAGELRRLWRLALALDIAAAMQAATDFTTDYVKQRQVFGRPVGSFQAVQHRLAADAEKCRGTYWLAIKAAWSGSPLDAALAALQAQRAVTQVNYDMHQFNGALGMTLEHALHLWTFRLRWLVGEMGGYRTQAADVAALAWPDAPRKAG